MQSITLVPASQADRRDVLERIIAESTQKGFFGDNETKDVSPWPRVQELAWNRCPYLIITEGGAVGYMLLDGSLPSTPEPKLNIPLFLLHIEIYSDARREGYGRAAVAALNLRAAMCYTDIYADTPREDVRAFFVSAGFLPSGGDRMCVCLGA